MDPYLFWPIVITGFCTMIYGSIMDHRKRSVNYLLFVPLMMVTTIVVVLHGEEIFALISILLFLSLFIDSSKIWYLLSVAAISVSGLLLLMVSATTGVLLPWIFMMIFAFLGYREVLFGKGDIKASLSLVYSMGILSLNIGNYIYIPLSFVFFMNLGIASAMAFSWAMYYIWKVTGKFGFTVKYSGKVDEVKFKTMGENGNIIAYNIPFMIAITLAYFITMFSFLTGSVA